MDLQVELIKPKAQEFNRELNKVVDVDVKQYTIMVDGKGLGYVCQAEGLPINWLPLANVYSQETLSQLEAKVIFRLTIERASPFVRLDASTTC
jgi:hypothetical protein